MHPHGSLPPRDEDITITYYQIPAPQITFMIPGQPISAPTPAVASLDGAQQGSYSSLRDLVTPELIARAHSDVNMSMKSKYAEVINSQYTVKLGPRISHYEYRVLEFLDTIPDFATLKPIDFFDIEVTKPAKYYKPESTEVWHVIIMSTVPGQTLGQSLRILSRDERKNIFKEAMDCVDIVNRVINAGASFPDPDGVWRPIQRPTDTICNLDGENGRIIQLPFYRGVMPGSVHFDSFVSTLSKTCPQPPATAELLESTLEFFCPEQASDIRFCHMDLHQDNIMVLDGKLSGLIDWEMSGWFTWQLEVLGGMKGLNGPEDILPYVEAWDVPSKLEKIIMWTLPKLDREARKYRREQEKLARTSGELHDPFMNGEWRKHRKRCQAAKEAVPE